MATVDKNGGGHIIKIGVYNVYRTMYSVVFTTEINVLNHHKTTLYAL